MIEFLKNLLKRVNFKTDNEEINRYNKIIYSVIIICAVIFVCAILYFIIRFWPDFVESIRYNWNDMKLFVNSH